MPTKSQKTMVPNVPESVENGITGSNTQRGSGGNPAASAELALKVEQLAKQNAALERKLSESSQAQSNIQALIAALSSNNSTNANRAPVEADPVNRTTDFKNQLNLNLQDGQAAIEQQEMCSEFRDEAKKPISISKSQANYIGAFLSVSVNGASVRIPCDGNTYYINETHWIHAKERLAKLDAHESRSNQTIVMGE